MMKRWEIRLPDLRPMQVNLEWADVKRPLSPLSTDTIIVCQDRRQWFRKDNVKRPIAMLRCDQGDDGAVVCLVVTGVIVMAEAREGHVCCRQEWLERTAYTLSENTCHVWKWGC